MITYLHKYDIVPVTTAHSLNTHGYGNRVCLQGELWLHSWPSLGNAQVRLVLAALVCSNGGPTVTDQSSSGAAASATLICSVIRRLVKIKHSFDASVYCDSIYYRLVYFFKKRIAMTDLGICAWSG